MLRLVLSALTFPWRSFRDAKRTAATAAPCKIGTRVLQAFNPANRRAYWPMHFTSTVAGVRRIRIGIGSAPGLSPGCYIQGTNGIEIGDYTLVAPNVGIISANHRDDSLRDHHLENPIRIGSYCWIGMNAIILPGVELGNHTYVGAGAVVTKSFPDGYCVIAGNPARVIRAISKDSVTDYVYPDPYIGYLSLNGRTKEEIYNDLRVEKT
jgi:acetyltransferase-like isoleucine patch superfamily enzyme